MNEMLLTLLKETSLLYFEALCSMTIGSLIGDTLSKSISLNRLSKYEDRIIVDDKKIRENINKIKENKISYYKKKPMISECAEKIVDYLPEKDRKLLYNNFKSLKVKANLLQLLIGWGGSYTAEKNKIVYSEKRSIGHEMLHMASTLKIDNQVLTGFRQRQGRASIGTGINEGYTELLASRIFNKGKVNSYHNEVLVMRLIEKFFDNPKDLSHLYFNCNLPGLIYHLERYSSRKEVVGLILDVDMMNGPSMALVNPIEPIKKVKSALTLYDMYKKKTSDPVKIKEFEDILCEDKLIKFFVNREKVKVVRNQIYSNNFQFEGGYSERKK